MVDECANISAAAQHHKYARNQHQVHAREVSAKEVRIRHAAEPNELQNVLAAFPVLSCAFEIFPQPLFMVLFWTEFLFQSMS